ESLIDQIQGWHHGAASMQLGDGFPRKAHDTVPKRVGKMNQCKWINTRLGQTAQAGRLTARIDHSSLSAGRTAAYSGGLGRAFMSVNGLPRILVCANQPAILAELRHLL